MTIDRILTVLGVLAALALFALAAAYSVRANDKAYEDEKANTHQWGRR